MEGSARQTKNLADKAYRDRERYEKWKEIIASAKRVNELAKGNTIRITRKYK